MEPVTTVSLGVVTAYLAKDAVFDDIESLLKFRKTVWDSKRPR